MDELTLFGPDQARQAVPDPRQVHGGDAEAAWTRWTAATRAPMCTRCIKAVHTGTRQHPVRGVHVRKLDDITEYLCPAHAQEQRELDDAARAVRRTADRAAGRGRAPARRRQREV